MKWAKKCTLIFEMSHGYGVKEHGGRAPLHSMGRTLTRPSSGDSKPANYLVSYVLIMEICPKSVEYRLVLIELWNPNIVRY